MVLKTIATGFAEFDFAFLAMEKCRCVIASGAFVVFSKISLTNSAIHPAGSNQVNRIRCVRVNFCHEAALFGCPHHFFWQDMAVMS